MEGVREGFLEKEIAEQKTAQQAWEGSEQSQRFRLWIVKWQKERL